MISGLQTQKAIPKFKYLFFSLLLIVSIYLYVFLLISWLMKLSLLIVMFLVLIIILPLNLIPWFLTYAIPFFKQINLQDTIDFQENYIIYMHQNQPTIIPYLSIHSIEFLSYAHFNSTSMSSTELGIPFTAIF